MIPLIYLLGDELTEPLPHQYPLIQDGMEEEMVSSCSKCFERTNRTSSYFYRQNQDLESSNLESSTKALGIYTFPLVFLQKQALKISINLKGARLVPAGYSVDINDDLISGKKFDIKPKLGTIEFNFLPMVFYKESSPLVYCDECLEAEFDIVDAEEVSLDFTRWDGSDAFLCSVAGTFCQYVTETGKKKLEELGVTNLKFHEVSWEPSTLPKG